MKNRFLATDDHLLRLTGVFGFLGVALGAIGAHALADTLESAGRAETWATAVLYHLVHTVALLVLAALPNLPGRRWIAVCWSAGIFVFSGSLYLLCLSGITWLGAVTPLGGLAFLAGWAWLAIAGGPQKAV